MSDYEEMLADDADEQSSLTLLQRVLLGVAMWPTVLGLGASIPAALLEPDSSFYKLGIVIALMMSLAGGKHLWRFLSKGPFRAGIVFGAFSLLLLLGVGVAAAGIGASLEDGSFDQLTDDNASAKRLAGDEAAPEQPRQLPGSVTALGAPNRRGTFSSCIDELHHRDGERSMRDEAFATLATVAGPELAKDAVQDVMLSVCEKYGEGEVRKLRPYFFKSVYYARADLRKRSSRWQYCELEEKDIPRCQHDYDGSDNLRLMRAAMCRVDSREASVIRKRLDGASHNDIASELGITAANSRQIYSRAKASLKEEFEKLSDCSLF